MKSLKALLLVLAGGVPAGAVTFWDGSFNHSPVVTLSPVPAYPQADDGGDSAPPPGGFFTEPAAPSLAEAPASDSSSSPRDYGGRGGGGMVGRFGRGLGRRFGGGTGADPFAPSPSATPEERARLSEREAEAWGNFLAFLKNNSPNRYQLLTHLNPPPGSPSRVRLLQRWLILRRQDRTQPAMYAIHVQQFREEDAVLGFVADLKLAKSRHDDTGVEKAKAAIGAESGKLVALNLQERMLRVQAVEKLLDEERGRLERDTANRDQLASERAQQIIQRAEDRRGAGDAASPTTGPSVLEEPTADDVPTP